MEIQIDARGKQCPLPVIEVKNAIAGMAEAGTVTVTVDNEIAVQNIVKMAQHKGHTCSSKGNGKEGYEVCIAVADTAGNDTVRGTQGKQPRADVSGMQAGTQEQGAQPRADVSREEDCGCTRSETLVVISSNCMGDGDERLGKTLLKGYIYALSKLETEHLPGAIVMYNTGAYLPLADSESLEDLKALEARGVKIQTCGTCLDFYGQKEKLAVGSVTNMYTIAEEMAAADKIIKP